MNHCLFRCSCDASGHCIWWLQFSLCLKLDHRYFIPQFMVLMSRCWPGALCCHLSVSLGLLRYTHPFIVHTHLFLLSVTWGGSHTEQKAGCQSVTLLIFLFYLSVSSGALARGSEQSRGFCSNSIQWPLSLHVISSGWKLDLVSQEGGEAWVALIRTEPCNHGNIHSSP